MTLLWGASIRYLIQQFRVLAYTTIKIASIHFWGKIILTYKDPPIYPYRNLFDRILFMARRAWHRSWISLSFRLQNHQKFIGGFFFSNIGKGLQFFLLRILASEEYIRTDIVEGGVLTPSMGLFKRNSFVNWNGLCWLPTTVCLLPS